MFVKPLQNGRALKACPRAIIRSRCHVDGVHCTLGGQSDGNVELLITEQGRKIRAKEIRGAPGDILRAAVSFLLASAVRL